MAIEGLGFRRIALPLVWLLGSLLMAWLFAPQFHCNKEAREVLVTVFSVLAGVLVALMTISSDARRLDGRSRRESVWFFREMKREISAQKVVFWIYLSVLALLFLDALKVFDRFGISRVSDYVIVWLSVVSLVSSFVLPSELTRRQIEALTAEIRSRS